MGLFFQGYPGEMIMNYSWTFMNSSWMFVNKKTMNVHERSSTCSWTVHEYSWTTNETFTKVHEFMNLFCSWTLTLFMNMGCSWTVMNSDNSWTKACSWTTMNTTNSWTRLLMNIYERSLNVFMNYSWMFLNNKCETFMKFMNCQPSSWTAKN